MTKLKISPQLALPLSFVTTTQAILGKKRCGKSYKASVQAEELLKAGQQIVVMDPTSAWWGLRSSPDGKSHGFPVVIFGGEHADLPLESTAGEIIADAILTDGFSAIIDTTLLTKGEEQRFCAVFLDRLYRKKRANSGAPVHLFLDEADVYAPQKPFGEEARTLGACQSLVRRGGIKGIGCTLITQRPAVLNKDVLSQVDMLTVLRMNHPKDLDAIDTWVRVHGDPDTAKKMIAELPSLPLGEAYVWAPVEDIFKRITFRDRETYDSGATPKAGEKRREAKLAAVDLESLGESIRGSVERAKENDPKLLKAKIAELVKERDQLSRVVNTPPTKTSTKVEEAEIKKIEVPIIKEASLRRIEKLTDNANRASALALEGAKRLTEAVAFLKNYRSIEAPKAKIYRSNGITEDQQRATWKTQDRSELRTAPVNGTALPEGEAMILRAAIQFPNGLAKPQLTTLTGYRRSTRDAYISRLKTRGYLAEHERGLVFATDAGRSALPDAEPLPTGHRLRAYWYERLPAGERVVLELLVDQYPNAVDKQKIDEATGFKRSTRDAYISRLVAKELVSSERGGARANETLFD